MLVVRLGKCYATCDRCGHQFGEGEEEFILLEELVEAMRASGWVLGPQHNEWLDLCVTCKEGEQ